MSRYAYFPGCSLHATAREYDESIRAIAGLLGWELKEIDDWCCCGATPAHALDPKAAKILGLWNLGQAAKSGAGPLLTGCASCFSRLRTVAEEAREHPASIGRGDGGLGASFDPDLPVLHIAQVLASEEMADRLKAAITRPLAGLKVACYYGCLLTRPRGAGAVDDPENPQILEDLVRRLGAEPVDWPLRLDCCGASMALPRPDLVMDLSGKILAKAHERGANVVLVACPLCHSNLDFKQDAIQKRRGESWRIPVVYLTQLVGLALGISADRLGLKRHFIPVPIDRLLAGEGAARV
ncbi:MAG: CoB--CoM heterodisulfide reductase iron-sulfur subunit B family protein [Candidatus Eisenbacteria bacterium]|nr:CoB--CoM heterodisulfide reductase iron-sulfur subunit B family protein [Candidatus Eisenbacteria bacterium]